MLDPDIYTKRRKRLMSATNSGLIIVPPHPYLIYANDKMIKYRPHANTIYLTGVKQHDTVLILDTSQHKTFLFILDKNPQLEQWHGRRLTREEAGEISGIELIYFLSELEEKVQDLLKPVSTVHMDFGINIGVDQVLRPLFKENEVSVFPLQEKIDQMRLFKDEHEVKIIRKSVDLSVDAHIEAIKQTYVGISEIEIETIYANHFRLNGGILPTYEANVSSGENSLILHHHATQKKVEEGEMILVDCGAEFKHYTADLARTWPVSGTFTNAQKKVYDVVLETNKKCIEMVNPGVAFWDIQRFAIQNLVDGLFELGIVEGDKGTFIEEKQFRRFFPHGIGHFLGMDGHDTSTIDRKEVVLQPNMYITIEPGLYIPRMEEIPKEYHHIGVRIEDNILVTADGHENLSIRLPKEIKDIEKLVGSSLD